MCFFGYGGKRTKFLSVFQIAIGDKWKRKVAPLLENVALLPVTRLNFACVGNLSEMSNFAV